MTYVINFALHNKFIDTLYKLVKTYSQVSHLSIFDLKMKTN